jgi:hypothetical protein
MVALLFQTNMFFLLSFQNDGTGTKPCTTTIQLLSGARDRTGGEDKGNQREARQIECERWMDRESGCVGGWVYVASMLPSVLTFSWQADHGARFVLPVNPYRC